MDSQTQVRGDEPARRTWKRLAFVVCILWGVAVGILYIRIPSNPDSAIFDYIGWSVLHGARPYLDVVEQNFPGQIWLHVVSTALFGNHLWSYRLFDYLLVTLTGVLLLRLLRPARLGPGSLTVIALYQAMVATSSFWISGQRDVVVALFLAGAAAAYRARARGGSRAYLAVFALCLAYAVLIRPTYAVFGVLVVIADVGCGRDARRRLPQVLADGAVAGALTSALLAVVALLAWRTGSLSAWYDATVRFNIHVYTATLTLLATARSSLWMLSSWHWYLAFAAVGTWLWWRSGRDRLTWALGLAMAATAFISAVVQRKGFGYHLGGLLAPQALFAAYLIEEAVAALRAKPRQRLHLAGAVLVCTIAMAGMGSKIKGAFAGQIGYYLGRRTATEMLAPYDAGETGLSVADVVAAADHAARTVPAGGTVLSWTRGVHINFLAQRQSPTRFPVVGMLVLARQPFALGEDWARELAAALAERPPELIFVPGQPQNEGYAAVWEDLSPSPSVRVLRHALETRYAPERSFGSITAYRLRPLAPAATQ